MKKLGIIFLDMDGVLCDLVSALWAKHSKDPIPEYPQPGKFVDIAEWFNVENIWEPCGLADDHALWAFLDAQPWAVTLYQICQAHAERVVFATKPTAQPTCWSGKFAWLQMFTNQDNPDVVMWQDKWELGAIANSLLIDDTEYLIDRFVEQGGRGILFPQVWNRRHEDDKISTVIEGLHEACSD